MKTIDLNSSYSARSALAGLTVILLSLIGHVGILHAQTASEIARQGPYERLVIANAMVVPGHGGPAYGPADIVIENSIIVQIVAYNAVTGRPAGTGTPTGDRVIDASGMYVTPGLIDMHCHIVGPKANTARKMRPE